MNTVKILLVEDSEFAAKAINLFLEQILEELGVPEDNFAIDLVDEEKEAVKSIGTGEYGLIILDGMLKNGGLGKNVLFAIDRRFYPQIIGASTEISFVDFCKAQKIHAFPKEKLNEAEDLMKKMIRAGM
jgi:CheY-like chemotaxis protein